MYTKNPEKQTKSQLLSSFNADEISIRTQRPAQMHTNRLAHKHTQRHRQPLLHQSPSKHTCTYAWFGLYGPFYKSSKLLGKGPIPFIALQVLQVKGTG